jgi:L-arabinokinase
VTVAFYISGHGFGHASRQVEIINGLVSRHPAVRVFIRSAAARWLLERTLRVPFELDPRPCDTGIVQIDSLRLDARQSLLDARDFYATLAARADDEARLLRERDTRLVIVDAAPLGCEAAARAGIPSVVVSNFTWDWIYEEYAELLPLAPDLVPVIQRAYRQARAAWRLPIQGGFASFDAAWQADAPQERRVLDVPFVARHADPSRSREEVLGRLSLPGDRRVALVSFGGYGAGRLALNRLDCADTWTVVLTGGAGERLDRGHLRIIADTDIYDAGLRYPDLVRASDVVVTKPGYGIVSECVANGTAMVYTPRGRFAEYPVMLREMPRYLRCAPLDNAALLAGRWLAALDAAAGAPPPPEQPATDGAEVVADMIAACLRDASSSPAPLRS